MPPKQKKTFEATLELEAGNAAMVDLGKMLGPTGVNTRNVKVEYDEATSANR
ncbi:MAG TPA: 50S ribosomal protein L11, partial [Pseudonocardiaceae bacterium]